MRSPLLLRGRPGWRPLRRVAGLGLLISLAAGQLVAQSGRPRVQAVPLEIAPQLDGDVIGDPAWSPAPPASGFVQTRPFAGQPASEATEVRIGFTADTLWVSVICYDEEPQGIIVADARRDASLTDTDSFQLVIDAFRDTQNGFVFGTNAAGIEYDGQLANEGGGGGPSGGGGRFARGSGGGFNLNWDGVWNVATVIGDFGWSAEFAIPFATLRYPQGREQEWGINFQRVIRRKNETVFWAPLERQFNLYRLSEAGTVFGVKTPKQRNLKLTPYASYTGRRRPVGNDAIDSELDGGLDVKYGLTPSLTLDVTLNTDFAQVEVDEQQVNLDRFNLFFPEKRPFFLENAGLFSVGAAGEAELFFSRRVGIDGGSPVPIDGGVRLSGKAGRTNLGFLGMRTASTRDEGGSQSGDDFLVGRVSRELPNRSSLGALIVSRQVVGSPGSAAGDENRTFALDGKLGIGTYQSLSGWVARTDTPGIERSDHAFEGQWSLDDAQWNASVSYLEVGEGFNPEVGFLARDGFRKFSGRLLRRVRPEKLWGLHELRPHVSYSGYRDFAGTLESELVHLDNHWEWRGGEFLSAGINFTHEGVKEEFEIAPGTVVPVGAYGHDEIFIVFRTNRGAPVSWSIDSTVGGFFGGDRVSIGNTLSLRRSEALTSELTWSYNDIRLPAGSFETNLGRLRLSYSPKPRILLQLLTQYNDTTSQVSSNLRFSWLRDANTGLFVVFNEIDEFGAARASMSGFARADRSLIVKYSHLIDVFKSR